MRSIANTTIQFGLVSIPVKMYSATKSDDVSFSLMSPAGNAVEQVYRDRVTGEVVGARNACERGFEGRMLNASDIERIDAEAKIDSQGRDLKHLNIDAGSMIPLKALNDNYSRISKSYIIGPNTKMGNLEGFATILEAMKKRKVAAIVKWIPRSRQEMLAIYEDRGIMRAVAVTFATDLVEPESDMTAHQSIKVNPALLDVAMQLIDSSLDKNAAVLNEMQDEAVAKRKALIESVLAGAPMPETTPVETTVVPDLMGQMMASLKVARETSAAR